MTYFNSWILTWHGNAFHITGHLGGEATSHWWIPLTKAGNVLFDDSLNKLLNKESIDRDWRRQGACLMPLQFHVRPRVLWAQPMPWLLVSQGSFHYHGLTETTAWISNYIHCIVWGEITHPFPNVEVWERINKFIPHYTMDVITYPFWESGISLSKRARCAKDLYKMQMHIFPQRNLLSKVQSQPILPLRNDNNVCFCVSITTQGLLSIPQWHYCLMGIN